MAAASRSLLDRFRPARPDPEDIGADQGVGDRGARSRRTTTRVTVNEIACTDPACPGLETVILVMRKVDARAPSRRKGAWWYRRDRPSPRRSPNRRSKSCRRFRAPSGWEQGSLRARGLSGPRIRPAVPPASRRCRSTNCAPWWSASTPTPRPKARPSDGAAPAFGRSTTHWPSAAPPTPR